MAEAQTPVAHQPGLQVGLNGLEATEIPDQDSAVSAAHGVPKAVHNKQTSQGLRLGPARGQLMQHASKKVACTAARDDLQDSRDLMPAPPAAGHARSRAANIEGRSDADAKNALSDASSDMQTRLRIELKEACMDVGLLNDIVCLNHQHAREAMQVIEHLVDYLHGRDVHALSALLKEELGHWQQLRPGQHAVPGGQQEGVGPAAAAAHSAAKACSAAPDVVPNTTQLPNQEASDDNQQRAPPTNSAILKLIDYRLRRELFDIMEFLRASQLKGDKLQHLACKLLLARLLQAGTAVVMLVPIKGLSATQYGLEPTAAGLLDSLMCEMLYVVSYTHQPAEALQPARNWRDACVLSHWGGLVDSITRTTATWEGQAGVVRTLLLDRCKLLEECAAEWHRVWLLMVDNGINYRWAVALTTKGRRPVMTQQQNEDGSVNDDWQPEVLGAMQLARQSKVLHTAWPALRKLANFTKANKSCTVLQVEADAASSRLTLPGVSVDEARGRAVVHELPSQGVCEPAACAQQQQAEGDQRVAPFAAQRKGRGYQQHVAALQLGTEPSAQIKQQTAAAHAARSRVAAVCIARQGQAWPMVQQVNRSNRRIGPLYKPFKKPLVTLPPQPRHGAPTTLGRHSLQRAGIHKTTKGRTVSCTTSGRTRGTTTSHGIEGDSPVRLEAMASVKQCICFDGAQQEAVAACMLDPEQQAQPLPPMSAQGKGQPSGHVQATSWQTLPQHVANSAAAAEARTPVLVCPSQLAEGPTVVSRQGQQQAAGCGINASFTVAAEVGKQQQQQPESQSPTAHLCTADFMESQDISGAQHTRQQACDYLQGSSPQYQCAQHMPASEEPLALLMSNAEGAALLGSPAGLEAGKQCFQKASASCSAAAVIGTAAEATDGNASQHLAVQGTINAVSQAAAQPHAETQPRPFQEEYTDVAAAGMGMAQGDRDTQQQQVSQDMPTQSQSNVGWLPSCEPHQRGWYSQYMEDCRQNGGGLAASQDTQPGPAEGIIGEALAEAARHNPVVAATISGVPEGSCHQAAVSDRPLHACGTATAVMAHSGGSTSSEPADSNTVEAAAGLAGSSPTPSKDSMPRHGSLPAGAGAAATTAGNTPACGAVAASSSPAADGCATQTPAGNSSLSANAAGTTVSTERSAQAAGSYQPDEPKHGGARTTTPEDQEVNVQPAMAAAGLTGKSTMTVWAPGSTNLGFGIPSGTVQAAQYTAAARRHGGRATMCGGPALRQPAFFSPPVQPQPGSDTDAEPSPPTQPLTSMLFQRTPLRDQALAHMQQASSAQQHVQAASQLASPMRKLALHGSQASLLGGSLPFLLQAECNQSAGMQVQQGLLPGMPHASCSVPMGLPMQPAAELQPMTGAADASNKSQQASEPAALQQAAGTMVMQQHMPTAPNMQVSQMQAVDAVSRDAAQEQPQSAALGAAAGAAVGLQAADALQAPARAGSTAQAASAAHDAARIARHLQTATPSQDVKAAASLQVLEQQYAGGNMSLLDKRQAGECHTQQQPQQPAAAHVMTPCWSWLRQPLSVFDLPITGSPSGTDSYIIEPSPQSSPCTESPETELRKYVAASGRTMPAASRLAPPQDAPAAGMQAKGISNVGLQLAAPGSSHQPAGGSKAAKQVSATITAPAAAAVAATGNVLAEDKEGEQQRAAATVLISMSGVAVKTGLGTRYTGDMAPKKMVPFNKVAGVVLAGQHSMQHGAQSRGADGVATAAAGGQGPHLQAVHSQKPAAAQGQGPAAEGLLQQSAMTMAAMYSTDMAPLVSLLEIEVPEEWRGGSTVVTGQEAEQLQQVQNPDAKDRQLAADARVIGGAVKSKPAKQNTSKAGVAGQCNSATVQQGRGSRASAVSCDQAELGPSSTVQPTATEDVQPEPPRKKRGRPPKTKPAIQPTSTEDVQPEPQGKKGGRTPKVKPALGQQDRPGPVPAQCSDGDEEIEVQPTVKRVKQGAQQVQPMKNAEKPGVSSKTVGQQASGFALVQRPKRLTQATDAARCMQCQDPQPASMQQPSSTQQGRGPSRKLVKAIAAAAAMERYGFDVCLPAGLQQEYEQLAVALQMRAAHGRSASSLSGGGTGTASQTAKPAVAVQQVHATMETSGVQQPIRRDQVHSVENTAATQHALPQSRTARQKPAAVTEMKQQQQVMVPQAGGSHPTSCSTGKRPAGSMEGMPVREQQQQAGQSSRRAVGAGSKQSRTTPSAAAGVAVDPDADGPPAKIRKVQQQQQQQQQQQGHPPAPQKDINEVAMELARTAVLQHGLRLNLPSASKQAVKVWSRVLPAMHDAYPEAGLDDV